MDTFTQGSILHGVCLLVCALATGVTVLLARRVAPIQGRSKLRTGVRHFLITGCVVSWILSNGYFFVGGRFSWDLALPLQFCNLANLIAAIALFTRRRTPQALMYFWAFALCIWAFITPSLYVGPASLWFWLFWMYHLFIPLSTAWILAGDGFRPTWADWRRSLLLTLAYMSFLALLDAMTGWNYGFVGPSLPTQRNLLDFLGAYPLRLLWMALIGAGLFFLLMLPWRRKRSQE